MAFLKLIAVGTAISFLFSACSTEVSAENKIEAPSPELEALRSLIKKTPLLPGKSYTLTPEFPPGKKLYEADGSTSDTLFFYPMSAIYGLMPDTSHFYSFLSYDPVENGMLRLTNIDHSGKVIDSKQLSTDLYGCGCGYQWFGLVYVNKDNSFLIRDSLVTFDCDTAGPLPEAYWKHEIASITASLSKEGKILFSKLQRTTVKEPATVQ